MSEHFETAEFKEFWKKYEAADRKTADRFADWLNEWLKAKNISTRLFDEIDAFDFQENMSTAFHFHFGFAANAIANAVKNQDTTFVPLKYIAYNKVIGSTPDEFCTELDFPGHYSLDSLLDRIIEGREQSFLPEVLLASKLRILSQMLQRMPVFAELLRPNGQEAAGTKVPTARPTIK